MSSERSGLISTFLFVSVFLGSFVFLYNAIPSGFFSVDNEYYERDYPDVFNPATMSSLNFTDSESFYFIFPNDYTNHTNFDLGGREYDVLSRSVGQQCFTLQHNEPIFIFSIWHYLHLESEYEIGLTLIQKYYSNDTDTSVFSMDCIHAEVTVIIGFNTTEHNTIEEAWSNKEIYCTIGIGLEEIATSIGAWQLLTQLLFFQVPDIHPAINFLIALPIWSCIAILVYMLILLALPFVG